MLSFLVGKDDSNIYLSVGRFNLKKIFIWSDMTIIDDSNYYVGMRNFIVVTCFRRNSNIKKNTLNFQTLGKDLDSRQFHE